MFIWEKVESTIAGGAGKIQLSSQYGTIKPEGMKRDHVVQLATKCF